MHDSDIDFQELVIEARAEAGLSQHLFAGKIGTSWITVWRWEKGYNKPKEDAIDYWIDKIRGAIK